MASTNDLHLTPTILGSWTQTDDGVWHIMGHERRRMGEDTPTYLTRLQRNENERIRYTMMGKPNSKQRIWYNNASAAERDAKKKGIKRVMYSYRWWKKYLDDSVDQYDDESMALFMLRLQCERIKEALEGM